MLIAAIAVLGLLGLRLSMEHLEVLRQLAERDPDAGLRGLMRFAAWVGGSGVMVVLAGGGYFIWYGRRVIDLGLWPLHRQLWPRRVRPVTGARSSWVAAPCSG